jgi:hypothetical protein
MLNVFILRLNFYGTVMRFRFFVVFFLDVVFVRMDTSQNETAEVF